MGCIGSGFLHQAPKKRPHIDQSQAFAKCTMQTGRFQRHMRFPMTCTQVFLAVLAMSSAMLALFLIRQQKPFESSDTSWHKFVKAPTSRKVAPACILSEYTRGNVSAAGSLASTPSAGFKPAVLTRLTAGDDIPTFVIDFGINLAGQLSIDFVESYNITTGYPGIMLAFSETLQYLTDRSDFTRSDNGWGSSKLTSGTDQVAVKPGHYTWTAQLGCEYGTKVCADGLHGFRYLKVSMAALPSDSPHTSAYGSISIAAINLLYTGYLGTPETFTGHFECSDTDITQWWYDAVYTNDLCTDTFLANNTEPRNAASSSLLNKVVLHDGPKRDRDPYIGDLAVSALTTYLSHDVAEAARNVLEDLALHQRDDGWIPPASINNYTLPLFDYPLWWVVCSVDYVMYTGNLSFWRSYHPAILNVLDRYYVSYTNSATSLIERPDGTGDFAFIPRIGPVTYYNALYVYALRYAARLAVMLGDDDGASRWNSRASVLGPALLQRNFDHKAGAFFDGGPCAGVTICPTHAQDGNSLAILAGVVSGGMSYHTSIAESILSYMNRTMFRPYGNSFYDNNALNPGADYLHRVYAFVSYFEIAARFETSTKNSQGALEELRRLYGWMATHDPALTAWEGIGVNGTPYEYGFTSMAHGWSTGIVPLLTSHVLGVKPTSPGFKTWSLKPSFKSLDELAWARGVVPIPDGRRIWVQWKKSDNGLVLFFEVPEGTQASAVIPVVGGSTSSVSVNGKTIHRALASQQQGYKVDTIHYISLTFSMGKHCVVVRAQDSR